MRARVVSDCDGVTWGLAGFFWESDDGGGMYLWVGLERVEDVLAEAYWRIAVFGGMAGQLCASSMPSAGLLACSSYTRIDCQLLGQVMVNIRVEDVLLRLGAPAAHWCW